MVTPPAQLLTLKPEWPAAGDQRAAVSVLLGTVGPSCSRSHAISISQRAGLRAALPCPPTLGEGGRVEREHLFPGGSVSPSTLGPSCFPPPSSRGVHGQDLWGAVTWETVKDPPTSPCCPVPELQDVRTGRGIFRSLNSLPTPNSLEPTGKLRPSRQDLPKVTLCLPRSPGKPRSRDPGSLVRSARRASPASRLRGGIVRANQTDGTGTDRKAHRLRVLGS